MRKRGVCGAFRHWKAFVLAFFYTTAARCCIILPSIGYDSLRVFQKNGISRAEVRRIPTVFEVGGEGFEDDLCFEDDLYRPALNCDVASSKRKYSDVAVYISHTGLYARVIIVY